MNRSQTVRIADAMCAIQPQWKQGGCISQLQVLAHTWQGTDAELAAHALLVAGDPTAQTPAAINNTPPRATKPKPSAGQSKEPICYICGNTRTGCQQLHDFEARHLGISDLHIFETAEEADANRSDYQVNDRDADRALVPLGAALDKIAEQSPERIAAKARARAAVDQARQKSKWKPAPPPDERRVQEPQPEETPADA